MLDGRHSLPAAQGRDAVGVELVGDLLQVMFAERMVEMRSISSG